MFDVEGQRLFQPEAHDRVGIFALVGQRVEIEQHDAGGRVGQHQADIAQASRNRRKQIAEGCDQFVALEDVRLLQAGSHQAGWQRRGRRSFQVVSAFVDARRGNALGGDLASDAGTEDVSVFSH